MLYAGASCEAALGWSLTDMRLAHSDKEALKKEREARLAQQQPSGEEGGAEGDGGGDGKAGEAATGDE